LPAMGGARVPMVQLHVLNSFITKGDDMYLMQPVF
jgi:hypothetical protein